LSLSEKVVQVSIIFTLHNGKLAACKNALNLYHFLFNVFQEL